MTCMNIGRHNRIKLKDLKSARDDGIDLDAAKMTVVQWLDSTCQSADDIKKALSASWLCLKMESGGTFLGLPLSRFAV